MKIKYTIKADGYDIINYYTVICTLIGDDGTKYIGSYSSRLGIGSLGDAKKKAHDFAEKLYQMYEDLTKR